MGFFLSPAPETSLRVLSNLKSWSRRWGFRYWSVSRAPSGATVGPSCKGSGSSEPCGGTSRDRQWRWLRPHHAPGDLRSAITILGNPREISQSRRQRPRVRSCLHSPSGRRWRTWSGSAKVQAQTTLARQDQTALWGGGSYPRQGSEWTAEPPNVQVACSGWYRRGCAADARRCGVDVRQERPPGTSRGSTGHSRRPSSWDRAPWSRVARRHRRLLHLVGRGSRVLARRPQGEAAYLHTSCGATDTCHGPGCPALRWSRGLLPCRANAGVRQAAARPPPNYQWPIRAARIHHVDIFNPWLGSTFIAERLRTPEI